MIRRKVRAAPPWEKEEIKISLQPVTAAAVELSKSLLNMKAQERERERGEKKSDGDSMENSLHQQ